MYCSVCGASLRQDNAAQPPTRRRQIRPVMVAGILALIIINLAVCSLSVSQVRVGLFFLLIYVDVGIFTAALWMKRVNEYLKSYSGNARLYRLAFAVLAVVAWPIALLCLPFLPKLAQSPGGPLKEVALLTGIAVPLFFMCIGAFMVIGKMQDRQNKNERDRLQAEAQQRQQQMEANLDTLAQTWGDKVALCDLSSAQDASLPYVTVPASAPRRMLFIDPRYADVSYWEDQLPADERVSTTADVTWVVCLIPSVAEQACDYEGGTKLRYQTVSMQVRLFYIGDQTLHVADQDIGGSAQDTCPDSIVLDGTNGYYVMTDGSHKSKDELHLDQTVTFEQVYDAVNAIIQERER